MPAPVDGHGDGEPPMANLNRVFLIGRLTRDPELRYTQSGVAICEFRLANNRSWTAPDGTKKEENLFVDVTVWKKQAEFCAEFLKKGRQVFVEGRLKFDEWEGPDGQKRSKLSVTAQNVQFLDSRGSGEGGGSAQGERPPEPTEPPPDEETPF